MAIQAKVVEFTWTAGVAGTQAVTGVGFQGKFLLLMSAVTNAAGGFIDGAWLSLGYGKDNGAGGADKYTFAFFQGWHPALDWPWPAGGRRSGDIVSEGTALASVTYMRLDSFDADGFTITASFGGTNGRKMQGLVLGGSSLQVAAGIDNWLTADGEQTVSSVGFQADVLLFQFASESQWTQGWCDSQLRQAACATHYRKNTGPPSDSDRVQYPDQVLGLLDPATGALVGKGACTAITSNGFKVGWSPAWGTAGQFSWVALKGISAHAIAVDAQNGTGAQPITGLTVTPLAALVMSTAQANPSPAAPAVADDMRFSFGMSDGAQQAGTLQADIDGRVSTATRDNVRYLSLASALLFGHPTGVGTGAIDAEAGLGAFAGGQAELDWVSNDNVDRQIMLLFLGDLYTPMGDTTTVVDAVNANYSDDDQVIQLTATISGSGGDVDDGTVDFTVRDAGLNIIGTPVLGVAVVGGIATTPWTLPGGTIVGSYTITADYSGTMLLNPSSGSAVLLVTAQLATFPRAGAWRGTDRLLVWVNFYGRDTSGNPDVLVWSGLLLWDPSTYELGRKEPRVLEFGYYDRALSGPRGDVRLSNAGVTMSDLDRLMRGMLGRDEQYALVGRQVVIKAILEEHWRRRFVPVVLFRGLVDSYKMQGEFEFVFDFKDWLGKRLEEPLPMFELTTDVFPDLPATNRGKFAPYLLGRLSGDSSADVPPTFVAEPAMGSYIESGIYPWAGYGSITDCAAAPPSGVSLTLEAGGALPTDTHPNPGQFGFMMASIDVAGKISDPVPFYANIDYSSTRGQFAGTPVPYETAVPGSQQIRVDFTPGAGAVTTRIWIGVYYFGARWTYYLDVAAPGNTVTFDKHPDGFNPPDASTMTAGGVGVAYGDRGQFVVAALVADGETAPSTLVNWAVAPYRRPLRVAWQHPTATEFAGYRAQTAGPPALTDWTKRQETTDTFLEFYPEDPWTAVLQLGSGRLAYVPVIHVGKYTAPITGVQFELFLACYGVGSVQSAVQGGVKVDVGNFDTTWAVPGLGTVWQAHFGTALFLEIDGIRFTAIGILGPDAVDAIAGTRTIVLNMLGYDDIGDGTGVPITSRYEAFKWLLKNVVLADQPHVLIGGDWLPLPLWNDGSDRMDEAAIDACEDDARDTVGVLTCGYYIADPRTTGEWMRKFLLDLDAGFGWTREGAATLALHPPAPLGQQSVDRVTYVKDIFKGSFRIDDDATKLGNRLTVRFDYNHETGEFGREFTIDDEQSQIDHGEPGFPRIIEAPDLELFGVLSRAAARAIGSRSLQRSRRPERTVVYDRGFAAIDLDLGSRYTIDHPEGADVLGFVDRRAQVTRQRLGVADAKVEVSSWDNDWVGELTLPDYVLEALMAEDLGGSRVHSPVMDDSNPQTLDPYDKPAAPALVQWEILPEDVVVEAYVVGRVEASGISMRLIVYNETDSAEIDDVVITSTAEVEDVIAVPAPLDGENKEYSLRAEITASGLPLGLSNYSVFFKGKLRQTFTP